MKTALASLTLLALSACTTLQPLPDASPATIRQAVQPGDRIEIERTDGSRQTLRFEAITDEAVQGTDGGQRLSIPLSSIRAIGTRSMTTSDKVWTGVAVAAAVGAAIALAGGGGDDGGSGGGGY